ncbi:protein of unknown function [Paraburkholderia dioscoreae]|uniref:Uncharacterized protein n=1 Tax=Paraburkholderia dioscoreae TaxID=2604047 RepID=A0A5Q4ZUJ8_9BURK|nr:protein of unknown function [Paraburkholderia dioscoreae]
MNADRQPTARMRTPSAFRTCYGTSFNHACPVKVETVPVAGGFVATVGGRIAGLSPTGQPQINTSTSERTGESDN